MIILKSRHEIEKMKISNRIVAGVLEEVIKKIRVGVTTIELDRLAESVILKKGGTPAFKGYRGYPNSLCISINEQVVHGIPSNRRLKEGDLVSIDLGVYHDGYYGDAAVTVGVGEITDEAKRLLDATQKALYIGIEKATAGNHLSDISNAVQMYVEGEGFSVVRAFVGHGIGTSLHEEPQVPNFGEAGKGPLLKSGMVLAIEPMVNAGVSDVDVLEDDWTVVTADGSLSAHFEHTVAITDNGVEILTKVASL
ncbi:MAG: type I methionyl aminopeptidase [Nitrospinae bacterium]|nr:type I methionyl aminopeptidase [Nitrospinota bacterium]